MPILLLVKPIPGHVITHEIGHGIGLGHVQPVDGSKLMEPFVNLGFYYGVQLDDQLGGYLSTATIVRQMERRQQPRIWAT